ncbi:MAG: transposase [Sterolibacterium sp.]
MNSLSNAMCNLLTGNPVADENKEGKDADVTSVVSPTRRYGGNSHVHRFRGVLLTNDKVVISDIALVVANVDERDAIGDLLLDDISGLLLGDKGFIRPILKEDLAQQAIDLQTPLRDNMRETRSKGFRNWMMAQRHLVETVIGQLAERFAIEANRARDLWHLLSRLYRKVAAHTLCILINRSLGRPDLAFDGLVVA